MLTDQEVFDRVARHLLTQGERAYDNVRGVCMYRKGCLKCAIGCLIPDDKYSTELEGLGVDNERVREALKGITESWDLLGAIQDVHDIRILWTQLPKSLRNIAKDFRLDPAVLDEFPNWQPKNAGGVE